MKVQMKNVVVIVSFSFGQRDQKEAKVFDRRGETIGQEIKKKGNLYLNIGDLENKKTLMKTDPYYRKHYDSYMDNN
jgi:hypothetical protein